MVPQGLSRASQAMVPQGLSRALDRGSFGEDWVFSNLMIEFTIHVYAVREASTKSDSCSFGRSPLWGSRARRRGPASQSASEQVHCAAW